MNVNVLQCNVGKRVKPSVDVGIMVEVELPYEIKLSLLEFRQQEL